MTTVVTNKSVSSNILQYLVEDCKRMDQKAQFQIYKLFYKAMYNKSLSIVKDPAEAENIMQESFFVAFEEIGACPEYTCFDAWLENIVQNRSVNSWRKNRDLVPDYPGSSDFMKRIPV